jgi:hypothetical protein
MLKPGLAERIMDWSLVVICVSGAVLVVSSVLSFVYYLVRSAFA